MKNKLISYKFVTILILIFPLKVFSYLSNISIQSNSGIERNVQYISKLGLYHGSDSIAKIAHKLLVLDYKILTESGNQKCRIKSSILNESKFYLLTECLDTLETICDLSREGTYETYLNSRYINLFSNRAFFQCLVPDVVECRKMRENRKIEILEINSRVEFRTNKN